MTKQNKKRIVLGSASPRRKELLEQIGVEFEIKTSDKEEIYESTIPTEIVQELALMKAGNVAMELEEAEGNVIDTIVIGADTVVVHDNKILGKPSDEAEAFHMLKSPGRRYTSGLYRSCNACVWRRWRSQRNLSCRKNRGICT